MGVVDVIVAIFYLLISVLERLRNAVLMYIQKYIVHLRGISSFLIHV